MNAEVPRWVGRLAALGLLLGLIASLAFLIVPPILRAYERDREAIAFNRGAIVRFERIAASLPEMKQRLATLAARGKTRRHYLVGATPALAAAELQKSVQQVVKSHGGNVSSVQILKGKEEGEFQRIAIRVQMRASIEALRAIFYNVEAGQPYLFIDNLEIRTRSTRRRRGGKVDADPLLVVGFEIYGYGLGGENGS